MIRKIRLSRDQLKLIHAQHGHSSGKGLSIYDVQSRQKVHVSNPIFLEFTNGKRHTIIASGKATNGHNVSQIVKSGSC